MLEAGGFKMKIMGERLRELRESAGYSKTQFAAMFKIGRTSLYRYEGENEEDMREIPITLALEISKRLGGISLDWMVGNTNIKYINQSENELTKIYKSLSEQAQGELFNYAIYLKNKEGGEDDE